MVIASLNGNSVRYTAKTVVHIGRVDMQVQSGDGWLFNILTF